MVVAKPDVQVDDKALAAASALHNLLFEPKAQQVVHQLDGLPRIAAAMQSSNPELQLRATGDTHTTCAATAEKLLCYFMPTMMYL